MFEIKPLDDRIIVKRLEEEPPSAADLAIPDTAVEKPLEREVLAVGTCKVFDGNTRLIDVKVGDRVLFGKYSGTEVKVDGGEYLVLREQDILAVIEK